MDLTTDSSALGSYAPILVLVGLGLLTALGMLLVVHLLGPKRKGPLKDDTYESGVPLVGDARGRFNVRFYLVALLFLLFDVEVVFLWPWAPLFRKAAMEDRPLIAADGMLLSKDFLLVAIGIFLIILVVGFVYEWRKGIFRWS